MSRAMTAPEPATADWEAFYQAYRKPGYVPGYEITSKLGGGMFGLVFKARKQSIGKDYAIKFLKVDDGEVRRAVLQELEQVRFFAQVDHPNLVSIEDRGEVDGIPFIVMAYAGSETLRDRLGTGEPDRQELLRYFLQACRGVAALHERSLVHFDLKPANIFLKGGVARVGDYGLSKLVAHSRNSLSMGRGTPYYMAPEMLQRRGDHRSDVYSLGIMLYEVLTGDVPFKGDSEWEVLRKHETEAPRFPEHVIPPYRSVLEKCLAKDPEERFASVHEIMAALGAPASPGAAAWEDVRAGVETVPTPPPAAPVPPPPGPDDSRGPYLDVARRAQATARQVALEAMKDARVAAGKAMRDAQAAMHDAVGRYKRRQERRRARRLARQQERQAKHAARRAQAPEGWPELHGGRRKSNGGWVLFGLVVGAALWLTWTTGASRQERRRDRITAVMAEGPSEPVAPLPPELAELTDQRTRVFAEAMRARLEALRRQVGDLRNTRIESLPRFEVTGSADPLLEDRVRAFAASESFDSEDGRVLMDAGYPALLAAVKVLRETPVDDPEGVRLAVNVHRVLQQATGFSGIELDREADPADIARATAQWGSFLRTVVSDPEDWQVYRRIKGR